MKKRNLKQLRSLKTPQMSEGTRNRKETRVGSLREELESNIRMIEKTVWQDGKDCTLDVPVNLQNNRVYGKEKKADIPDKNWLSLTNKMSKKIMVSTTISLYGVTEPYFVNKNGTKVNKENYSRHLRK